MATIHLKHMSRLPHLSSSSLFLPFVHLKPLSSFPRPPDESAAVESTASAGISPTPSEILLLDKFHTVINDHSNNSPNYPDASLLTLDFTIPSLSNSFSLLSPSPLPSCLVHRLIRRCASPRRVVHFPQTLALFNWWISSKGVSADELAVPFNDMVDFAGKARLFNLTWSLLDAMLDVGVPITLDTFARIVRWYASAGLMSEASHAFRRMEDYGCPCDLTAFSATVTLLSKNSSAANALAFFDQHKDQFPPSSVVYTTAVHACCRENKIDDVMRLFNEMKENGCTVKGYTYTAVVGALSRAGEIAIAYEVLDQMLASCGGQPNIGPFNAMMREYIKLGYYQKTSKLYNKILSLGCEPDVVTYNLLIDSHCRQNNLGGAMEVLNSMVVKKCSPNAFSFNPIFNLMVRFPGAVSVQELFSRMRVLKCKPNTVTYNLLMQNVRDDDKALLKLLKEMDEEGVEFNLNTYNLAIALLCRVGKCDDAYQQLCEMMEVKNLKPNEATYKTVLKSLMRSGEREKLKDVLEKLRKRGLRTRPF